MAEFLSSFTGLVFCKSVSKFCSFIYGRFVSDSRLISTHPNGASVAPATGAERLPPRTSFVRVMTLINYIDSFRSRRESSSYPLGRAASPSPMKRSEKRILTTHVGSLVRPAELKAVAQSGVAQSGVAQSHKDRPEDVAATRRLRSDAATRSSRGGQEKSRDWRRHRQRRRVREVQLVQLRSQPYQRV